ncbi:MAG: D-2-hydroxyacid dehydrogenase [Thermoguttaceae bacterium]|jgi:glycerate dehydrogenase
MRIVVFDGYTSNPGDLSWAELEKLGDCAIYDRTPLDQIVARAAGAEIVLTNKTPLTRETLDRLPDLRYIGVLATGYNVVDMEAATRHNIVVTNVPGYATMSVVQTAFAHLLNLTLHVAEHARGVAAGRWSSSADFCYWEYPLVELDGLTLGLVGLGQIGRAMALAGQAFGMKVLASDPMPPQNLPPGVRMVELDEVFCTGDVVSLHCPLNDSTRYMVNADRLAGMKPTAFLINTGRGQLVDERALADALNAGRIAGAGLDVLAVEPPTTDHPLLRAKNCYITPHIAWATKAARKRLLHEAAENIRAFLAGGARNVVNL